MTVVEEVKDRLDIAEIIGETVQLRKSGKNFVGFCPFHPNTRTPAFVVFPDTGTWRCFGACNEGGDVLKFVMKKEGWDFPQALSHLAERAGIELRPRTPQQEAAEEARNQLRELLEAAVTFYRHNLLHSEAGQGVREYLQGRGLGTEILESFGIGYAPDSWEATMNYLREKGCSEANLADAGMVTERDSGGHYDRFRNRIMFPIRDARGRMAGFGARIVDPTDVPKFLNSPQTSLFDKSRILYGLDKARRSIRMTDQVVIVEGYLDVIALHQAGYQNAVSPMGTALSEPQLRELKRYSRNMVLALDSDVAGSQATLRGLTVARQTLDRDPDPVFDARGLVRHEGRLDAEIRVVALPEGMDPDDVVVEDAKAWTRLLESAKPIVNYVTEAMLAGKNLEDAKVKAEVARQVLPLIEDVADPVEREAYRQSLARRLKVDERALLPARPQRSRPRSSAPAAQEPEAGSGQNRAQNEHFCLALLLTEPEFCYRVDRQLHALGLEGLSSLDFGGTEEQMIFQAIRSALAQVEVEPMQRWRELLQGSVLEHAEMLISGVTDLNLDAPQVAEAVASDFLRLRRSRVEEMLRQLGFQQQAIQETEPSPESREDLRSLAQQVQGFIAQKQSLDQALAGRSSLPQDSGSAAGWV